MKDMAGEIASPAQSDERKLCKFQAPSGLEWVYFLAGKTITLPAAGLFAEVATVLPRVI